MAYRTRIKYTPAQKNEIWDRWQRGESSLSMDQITMQQQVQGQYYYAVIIKELSRPSAGFFIPWG